MRPVDCSRRKLLAGLGALVLARPSRATSDEMTAAIKAFTGGAAPAQGGITLEVASLVDNGNTVPITVRVASPMTATDHVAAIAVFNERNPETNVAVFILGARAGKAEVSTRIRMATSQKLVAVARMSDGSFRMHSADVVVALAACIEGEA
ncbi:MAG: SoxY-related arm protein [Massilia sp.]|jgi:sulfur-oxidizing protein SoxY|nr:SoxY-related arm protein [Massilia sp.]